MKEKKHIAILDFGSQYTHLIAKRIRELGVDSRIYHNDIEISKIKNAIGIILSGGPKSIAKGNRLDFDKKIFEMNLPILGLCYGHQLIADFFGEQILSKKAREYGLAKIKTLLSPIFQDVKEETTVWMSHGDHVEKIPTGFKQIAKGDNDSVASMSNEEKKIYSFQFHPEVSHTEEGNQMLSNFIYKICKAQKNWTTATIRQRLEEQIIKEAGNKNIFLLISGGVDSTVCFALLEKTLGKERVYGVHIDHGLMRLNESKEVNKALKNIGLDDLHIYDAEKEYLEALRGIIDPEEKRKIIGDLFLDITDRIMSEKNMSNDDWLVGQGTIYPDTIESGGTKNSDKIKTHHNRVPRIQQMIIEGKIIEPIKDLYKDEVRKIGIELGLPEELVWRHTFPGPGLAIQQICSLKDDYPIHKEKILKKIKDMLKHSDLKAFILPIKSVGVQGDERSYAHAIALMGNASWEALNKYSIKITNSFPEINRVVWIIGTSKFDVKNIKVSPATITKERLDLHRQADYIANKILKENNLYRTIYEFPIIMTPVGLSGGQSIVLRPLYSENAMTVEFAKLPINIVKKIAKEILKLNGIDMVFYDITNKPPATVQWE